MLLVLGAGASYDYDLPLGNDLISRISELLQLRHNADGHLDSRADKTILQAFGARQEMIDAALMVSDGVHLVRSIDSFLENHQDDERVMQCGKLAIVRAILEAERRSKLNGDPALKQYRDTWLPKFFRTLNSGVRKSSLGDLFTKLSVINFNYDRCFEVFLVNALVAAYAISRDDAQALVEKLNIVHPYGTVGPLPWREGGLPFGGDEAGRRLVELARGIQTYSERVEQDALLKRIRGVISAAEVVVFLGFGFHEQNMDLMTPEDRGDSAWQVRIYATMMGISAADQSIVRARIASIFAKSHPQYAVDVNPVNGSCSDLFDAYALTLSS